MVLLGVLADEAISSDKTELRTIASAWLIDCAKHNDLPRILQVRSTIKWLKNENLCEKSALNPTFR